MLGFMCSMAMAQVPEPDKSPLDICYAPHNYPILKFQGKNAGTQPLARIIYSRPQKNGRNLFGNEIRFNEIWRLGANESTELELFRPATIGGKNIARGRYTLYCIPAPENWTIIISKDNFSWGTFSYKQANEVARITVPVTRPAGLQTEFFSMFFNEQNNLIIMWDNLRVMVPFVFNTGR